MNRVTDDRILIKGMRGTVVDLSFANTREEVVVGAVDSLGNLWWRAAVASEKVVEVLREVVEGEMMHRLIWCPYLPELLIEEEEEPDTSAAKLLVLTHGSQAEVWSLDLVVDEYGPGPWLLGM